MANQALSKLTDVEEVEDEDNDNSDCRCVVPGLLVVQDDHRDYKEA